MLNPLARHARRGAATGPGSWPLISGGAPQTPAAVGIPALRMSARAARSVAIANLFGRITGLVRDILFAAVFGAGAVADAFNAAFRVPQILRELFAEGSLQNVVVPAFADANERQGAEAAWRLANAVLGVLMLALGIATAVFFFGAEWWVRIVAEDFSQDPAKFALTVTLTRWMAPLLAGLSLSAFAGGLLNVRGQFFLPALAQCVMNVAVIVACLLAGPDAHLLDRSLVPIKASIEAATGLPPVVLVAAATSLSGFVQVSLCVPALYRLGFRFGPNLAGHPALKRLLGFFAMAFVGIVTVQFNLLVESQWAASFGDGVLTWLLGSFRLVQLPLALVAGTLATAMLPEFAAHISRSDRGAAGDALAQNLRTHAFLVLPCAAGLAVLAEPIVRLVYERGEFDAVATRGTAGMLQMYALAVFGICFHRLVVPAFYAMGQPRFPTLLSVGAMAAKIPVVLVLTRGFGMGAEALPLSHAVTVSAECVGLAVGLRTFLAGRGLLSFHIKGLVATVVLAVVAWALRDRVHVLVAIAGAGFAYLLVARSIGAWALPSMRRDPIPPFVEKGTRELLVAVGKGEVLVDGALLRWGTRTFRAVTLENALVFTEDQSIGDGLAAHITVPEATALVLLIEPRPQPRLVGLEFAGQRWHSNPAKVLHGGGVRVPVELKP